jgi:hypothetical protein
LFAIWLNLRWFKGLYFNDCSLIAEAVAVAKIAQDGTSVVEDEDGDGDKDGDKYNNQRGSATAAYIELTQVSEHGGPHEEA